MGLYHKKPPDVLIFYSECMRIMITLYPLGIFSRMLPRGGMIDKIFKISCVTFEAKQLY